MARPALRTRTLQNRVHRKLRPEGGRSPGSSLRLRRRKTGTGTRTPLDDATSSVCNDADSAAAHGLVATRAEPSMSVDADLPFGNRREETRRV